MAQDRPKSPPLGDKTLNPGDQAAPGTLGAGEDLCPECDGSGQLNNRPCPNCGGTGKVVQGIGGA